MDGQARKGNKGLQTENGLGVDGRVGPATIRSLNRDLYAEIKGAKKRPLDDTEIKRLKAELNALTEDNETIQRKLDTADDKLMWVRACVNGLNNI